MITIVRKQLLWLPVAPLELWLQAWFSFEVISGSYFLFTSQIRRHQVCSCRYRPCSIGSPACSRTAVMNRPTCLMNLYFRAMRPPAFCHSVYSEAANGGRRADPFVPRWDTVSNTPMLNKHSQTSGHLTPATGIPLVCLDDGGLLLSIASAFCWEAKEKAGHSDVLHIDSPTHIKLYLLALNKNRKGDLETLS